jgi:hypothetical protein
MNGEHLRLNHGLLVSGLLWIHLSILILCLVLVLIIVVIIPLIAIVCIVGRLHVLLGLLVLLRIGIRRLSSGEIRDWLISHFWCSCGNRYLILRLELLNLGKIESLGIQLWNSIQDLELMR